MDVQFCGNPHGAASYVCMYMNKVESDQLAFKKVYRCICVSAYMLVDKCVCVCVSMWVFMGGCEHVSVCMGVCVCMSE